MPRIIKKCVQDSGYISFGRGFFFIKKTSKDVSARQHNIQILDTPKQAWHKRRLIVLPHIAQFLLQAEAVRDC